MYIEYYEKEINLNYPQKKEAIEKYIKWCKDNNAGTPEATSVGDLESAITLAHVLYHLEMLPKEERPEWLTYIVGEDRSPKEELHKHKDFLNPVKDVEKADDIVSQIEWENFDLREEDACDRDYPSIEGIMSLYCDEIHENKADLEDEDLEDSYNHHIDQMIEYAELVEDEELKDYLADTKIRKVSWDKLSDYFGDVSMKAENKEPYFNFKEYKDFLIMSNKWGEFKEENKEFIEEIQELVKEEGSLESTSEVLETYLTVFHYDLYNSDFFDNEEENKAELKDMIEKTLSFLAFTEKKLAESLGYMFYPIQDIDNADSCCNSIDWDNYTDDNMDDDAYWAIESVLSARCDTIANNYDELEGQEEIETSLSTLSQVELYAKSMNDVSLTGYIENEIKRDKNTETIDFHLLADYFSKLSENGEKKEVSRFVPFVEFCADKFREDSKKYDSKYLQTKVEGFIGSKNPKSITPENVADHYPSMNRKVRDDFFNTYIGRMELSDEREMICKLYPLMAEQRKEMLDDAIDSIIQGRAETVAGMLDVDLEYWLRGVATFDKNRNQTNVIGMEVYGVKDQLKPLGEYIDEIKSSERYKQLNPPKESKPKRRQNIKKRG